MISLARRALALATFVALVTACPGTKSEQEKPASATATAAPQKLTIEGPIATVNGVKLDATRFLRDYELTLDRYSRARHPIQPALRERLKDNIVTRLVNGELVQQQAKKLGIGIPTAELDEKWTAHKKRYGSEQAFAGFLKRNGESEAEVKANFRFNLIREKTFASVSKTVSVEPAEVRKFFDDNLDRYGEPEQVRARHILIRVPPTASADVRAERRQFIEAILVRLKQGEKFPILAQEFGQDVTNARGGDLGFFTRGKMVKAFEEPVWAMQVGSLSGVIETEFGYHLVKKLAHKKETRKSFEEVKPGIERSLRARKRNEAIRNALAAWREQAKIEIFVKGDPKVIGETKPSDAKPATVKQATGNIAIDEVSPPSTSDQPVKLDK